MKLENNLACSYNSEKELAHLLTKGGGLLWTRRRRRAVTGGFERFELERLPNFPTV